MGVEIRFKIKNLKRLMNTFVRSLLVLVCIYFWVLPVTAQFAPQQDTSITACSGLFLDSGGSNGMYRANERQLVRFCADTVGLPVRLFFYSLKLGAGDSLCVFDGTDSSAPLLMCLTAENRDSFLVVASPSNEGGCVSVLFVSDSQDQGQGWEAALSCGTVCSMVEPLFTLIPDRIMPICVGDTIHWNAATSSVLATSVIRVFPGTGQLPTGEPLHPAIASLHWRYDPMMYFQQRESFSAKMDTAGLATFVLLATDTYGCMTEKAVTVAVHAVGSASCPNCLPARSAWTNTEICAGDSISVVGEVDVSTDSLFAYRTNPQYVLGFANHPPSTPYAAILPVQGVPLTTLTDPLLQIEQVCLTIRTNWAEDLAISLRAPSGEVLELSSGNGGGFKDYVNTCFTVSATAPIATAAAPFTGAFQPEGAWTAIQGARVNGDWALIVSDSFDAQRFGRVESWSIVFKGENRVFYSWMPADGLSCTDCPNPTIKPSKTAVYSVERTDLKGCVSKDSIMVTVRAALEAPEVECTFNRSGQALFSWNTVPGAAQYDLGFQVNGQDTFFSIPALDTFFFPPGFYEAGAVLRLTVEPRPDSSGLFCGTESGVVGCVFEPCTVSGSLVQTTEPVCFGDASGQVVLSGSGGFPPYQYQLGGSGATQESGTFSGLKQGDYFALVFDQNNCADSVFFEIGQPTAVTASVQVYKPILCAGDKAGVLVGRATGARGPVRFNWSTGAVGDTLSGVGTGTYVLTVLDSLGCFGTDSLLLGSPAVLSLSIQQKAPSCHNVLDGQIVPVVSGGTGSILFSWNTGAAADTLQNLGAGSYCVTATDASGCTQSVCVDFSAPLSLHVDSVELTPVDCNGRRTGEALVYVSGGTKPYTYRWEDPLAQVGPIATMLGGGPLGVQIQDANGCTLKDTVLIPEPALLAIELLSTPVRCRDGSDGMLQAQAMGGNAPYLYTWNTGSSASVLQNLNAGQYAISVTDAKGCRGFAQAAVTEPSTFLSASLEQTRAGCYGAQQNAILAKGAGGTGPNYTYRWNTGATTPELSGLDSLSYAVTVTDQQGCTKAATLKLKDLEAMDPNMIMNAPFCFGGADGAIGINFIQGRPQADFSKFTFVWSNGSEGPKISNLAGDRNYTVTVTDPIGCVAQVTRYLRQPKPLEVVTDKTDASCFGGSDGSVRVVSVDADTRVFRYRWELPLGTKEGEQLNGLAPGTYKVVVTDENGCYGRAEAVVEQPAAVNAQFIVGNNRCFGDATGSLQVVGTGGASPYQLTWADGGNGFQRQNLTAGTYVLTITDAKGCQAVSAVEVKSTSVLIATLETRDVTCNNGRDGIVTVAVSGGKAPYSYSLDGKSFKLTPALIGLQAGNYDVFVRDANGCQLFERAVIKEPLPFEVDAGFDSYRIKLGDSLHLSAIAVGAQGAVAFSWVAPYPGTLSCTACPTPIVFTQNTIAYQLLGIDSAGCEATDRVTVHVSKDRDILVPTGFSPNGDGLNDVLTVHGLQGTRILNFQVFDRWGELVYALQDFLVNEPAKGWDGNFRGVPMAAGVFVWYLEAEYIDGYKEVRRGQSTLIR